MPERELTFAVVGMSCGHCKATIERTLHELRNVHEVKVDLDAGTVTVHGSRLDEETLRRKIDEAGYVVRQRTQA